VCAPALWLIASAERRGLSSDDRSNVSRSRIIHVRLVFGADLVDRRFLEAAGLHVGGDVDEDVRGAEALLAGRNGGVDARLSSTSSGATSTLSNPA